LTRLPILLFGLLCGCVMGAGSEVADAQDIPKSSSQTLEDDFATVGQDFDDLIAREREGILQSGGIDDALLGPEADLEYGDETVSLEDLVDVDVQIRGIPVPPTSSGSGQQGEGEQGEGEQGEGEQGEGEQGEGEQGEGEQGEQEGSEGQGSQDAAGQPGGYQPGGAEGAEGEETEQVPDDIPDGQDDDIVARQLRELAENETDPELKERFWDEYRKYKAEN
jgi:hypothetical protein